jgi:hypothetical protein
MSATGVRPFLPVASPRTTVHWLIGLLAAALALRLGWLAVTQFAYEDAYITFRFAQNLAHGQGFVYNIGEPIYGTTTPLFTLLLAAGLHFIPNDPLLISRLIGLAAGLTAIALAWGIFTRSGLSDARRAFPIGLLVISHRLWVRDTGGMETSLSIALMLGAWYAAMQHRDWLSGLCAGLALWTRIDLVVWVIALVAALWLMRRVDILASPIKVVVVTTLTYLPWLVFALAYFGDMIPYTIIAKIQAYAVDSSLPLTEHLARVLRGLPPLTIIEAPETLMVGLTLVLAALGAWHVRYRRTWWPALIFWPLQLATLVLGHMTFQSRYFVPLIWITLLLVGIGLGVIWNRLGQLSPIGRRALRSVLVMGLLIAGLVGGWQQAHIMRDVQIDVNEHALKAVGQWLNANTPDTATVMLEPLGYVGYFAQRTMLDVVGLVTPRVVDLKRQQVPLIDMVAWLQPDYILLHCDDARSWLTVAHDQPNDFATHYARAAIFNPRNFNPVQPDTDSLTRTACYEIYGPRK